MNNILLVFLNNLEDSNCFDNIICDFETEGYKLYLYDEVNSDSFSYTDLPEIIRFYQNESDGVNKVVVLSNIRDLIYFWFRCYNQIVDDFIYLVEEEESSFFDVDDIYFNVYHNIFEFNKIEKETIEGKIYLSKKSNTILPLFYDPRYFQSYKYFDFHRNSNKHCINKTYEFEEYVFDFNIFETKNREVISIDKINKRIVFIKGKSSYDVLRILSDYNINYFRKLGYNVDVVDLLTNDITMINEKLINKRADFVFSLNCIGIDLKISDGRNLFDAINTPFLGNLGDHPVNQDNRISNSPRKTLFTCLDSENIYYMQKYFPDKKVITNFALAYKSVNYSEKSFLDREIDLIFVGTIKEPDSIKETWNSYNSINISIINDVCEKILSSDKILDIDHELEQYTYQYNIEEYTRTFLHSSIERYIRIYKRYHLVKKLGESNLKVVCIGNKDIYDKLNVSGNLIVYDNIDFQKLLDLFNNCKLLINMTGHLNNGVTERILSAMLNGAAVATERDMFTSANFINNENIILYDFNGLDELIKDIKFYLNNEERLEKIALNGQQAAKKYDFRTTAVKYSRIMRNFDESFNKEITSSSTYLPNINQYKKYINSIYDSGKVIGNGHFVNLLENRLSEYLGVKNLLLVSNTQLAMQIAYKLLKLKGDIITTPFNLYSTMSSIILNNLNPVYVDIDDETLNIDVNKIENKITDKTSCILTNHIFGNCCEIEKIKDIASKYNLRVIFDATHAFDVAYKESNILNQGNISFINLDTIQYFHSIEGAALIINDDDLYHEAKGLINDEKLRSDNYSRLFINAKMNEFQAAMGLCILNDINMIKYKRKNVYDIYHENLPDNLMVPKHNPNYGYFPIIFNSEKDLFKTQELFEQYNIITEKYFYPLFNSPDDLANKETPNAYRISKRIMCLPISEDMTENNVYNIIYLLKQ